MRNRCTNSRPQKSGFQNPSTIPISFSLPTHRPPIEHHPVRFFPSLQIHLRCSLLRDPSDQSPSITTDVDPICFPMNTTWRHTMASAANEKATSGEPLF
ncbi:hypothetical protein ES319_A13G149800v1 [Gossypium barbadense]|uniref:Uncharacterized protein n=1 Tax=Gossypium barbadense TaxID=3634 RepID=A0A5J5SZD9_GOSBA|nr:hypothetical protein ES319_A13G149800v1 [Gossypium barbadense]